MAMVEAVGALEVMGAVMKMATAAVVASWTMVEDALRTVES